MRQDTMIASKKHFPEAIMSGESEHQRIQRQIFALRRNIDVQLAYGDAAEANRLRDKIGDLERQIGQINQREREAREERG